MSLNQRLPFLRSSVWRMGVAVPAEHSRPRLAAQGSIAVADNVRIPGAPKYRDYMQKQQGKLWNTVEHKTHLEYQALVSDLVLESEYLGG